MLNKADYCFGSSAAGALVSGPHMFSLTFKCPDNNLFANCDTEYRCDNRSIPQVLTMYLQIAISSKSIRAYMFSSTQHVNAVMLAI